MKARRVGKSVSVLMTADYQRLFGFRLLAGVDGSVSVAFSR